MQQKRKAGRPVGSTGKYAASVKDMVEKALHAADKSSVKQDGVTYLEKMAFEQPASFMNLVGKLIPTAVSIDTTVTLNLADSMQRAADHLHAANKLAIEQGEQAVTLPIIDIVEKETET